MKQDLVNYSHRKTRTLTIDLTARVVELRANPSPFGFTYFLSPPAPTPSTPPAPPSSSTSSPSASLSLIPLLQKLIRSPFQWLNTYRAFLRPKTHKIDLTAKGLELRSKPSPFASPTSNS